MKSVYDPKKPGQSVSCDHCGAFRGRPCTTTLGVPISKIHKIRREKEK